MAITVISIFTILFPISIVDSRLSYLSVSSSTRLARLSPFPARFLILMRFTDVNAVSVAEKYAENIIRIIIAMP